MAKPEKEAAKKADIKFKAKIKKAAASPIQAEAIKELFSCSPEDAELIYRQLDSIFSRYAVNIDATKIELMRQAYQKFEGKNMFYGLPQDKVKPVAAELDKILFNSSFRLRDVSTITFIKEEIKKELMAVLTWPDNIGDKEKDGMVDALINKVWNSNPAHFQKNPEFLLDYFHENVEKLLKKENRNIAYLESFIVLPNNQEATWMNISKALVHKKKYIQEHILDEGEEDYFDALSSTIHSLVDVKAFFLAVKRLEITKKDGHLFHYIKATLEEYERLGSVDDEFWENVKAKWIENIEVVNKKQAETADANFRQQKRRTLADLKKVKGMLHMVGAGDDERSLGRLEFLLADSDCLKPYRFSPSDWRFIAQWMDIFLQHGYHDSPLPEVYEIDSKEYAEDMRILLPEPYREMFVKNQTLWEEYLEKYDQNENSGKPGKGPKGGNSGMNHGDIFHIELLGVYIPIHTGRPCRCCGYLVEEGKVVLFADRIKKFAEIHRISDKEAESRIRSCVLLHELSHWATHWLMDFHENQWICDFYYHADSGNVDVNTHEFLAQLMTWWVVSSDERTKYDFEDLLTPQNPQNPYALYTQCKETENQFILSRLAEIRNGCCRLTDSEMLDYLIGRTN
jgi:hypothetical protein